MRDLGNLRLRYRSSSPAASSLIVDYEGVSRTCSGFLRCLFRLRSDPPPAEPRINLMASLGHHLCRDCCPTCLSRCDDDNQTDVSLRNPFSHSIFQSSIRNSFVKAEAVAENRAQVAPPYFERKPQHHRGVSMAGTSSQWPLASGMPY
jgi:hypothetical protein